MNKFIIENDSICKDQEIIINGVTYVPRESISSDSYCIVRTYSAGVFAGYLRKREGMEATITNARRLWYWSGAASLSQLSQEGVKSPNECKFPMEVPEVILTQVIEILPCSNKAKKSIAEVKVWSA